MSGTLGKPTTEVQVELVQAPELGPAVGPAVGGLGVLIQGCFANKLLLLLILDSIL